MNWDLIVTMVCTACAATWLVCNELAKLRGVFQVHEAEDRAVEARVIKLEEARKRGRR